MTASNTGKAKQQYLEYGGEFTQKSHCFMVHNVQNKRQHDAVPSVLLLNLFHNI